MKYLVPVDIYLMAESPEAAEVAIGRFILKSAIEFGPQANLDTYVFPVGYPIEEVE